MIGTMTHPEILKKAIEKAVKNRYYFYMKTESIMINTSELLLNNIITVDALVMSGGEQANPKLKINFHEIIFSHDFAKAFWGDGKEKRCPICGKEIYYENFPNTYVKCSKCKQSDRFYPSWQYHLQQMVLEPEPLKYLEKFL